MPAYQPRSEELVAEREALDELVRSEGWRVFVLHVGREWKGAGYYARMNAVLKSDKPEKAILIHQTSEEILALLGYPERRIDELTEAGS